MKNRDEYIISEIRNFSRFYINILGLLNQGLLDSPYSMTEVRILLEIDRTENCSANALIERLNIDRGYMSRIVNRFEADELIKRESSPQDGRMLFLYLTTKGKKVLAALEEKSSNQIQGLICNLTDEEKEKLIESTGFIIQALSSGINNSGENDDKLKISDQPANANSEHIYIMF